MSDKTFKLLYMFLIVSGVVILAIYDHTYLAFGLSLCIIVPEINEHNSE